MARFFAAFCLTCALMFSPQGARALEGDHFASLLRDYQDLCSRMIAAPLAFHNDPRGSIAIDGEEEFNVVEDLSQIDYYVETPQSDLARSRAYGIVSNKVSNLLEQSCQVADYFDEPLSDAMLSDYAETVRLSLGRSDDFTLVGGQQDGQERAYAFLATGLFLGVDIMSIISISAYEISIEHIHLTDLNGVN